MSLLSVPVLQVFINYTVCASWIKVRSYEAEVVLAVLGIGTAIPEQGLTRKVGPMDIHFRKS